MPSKPLTARAPSLPLVTIDTAMMGANPARIAFNESTLSGKEPFVELVELPGAIEAASLLPHDFTPTASSRSDDVSLLARGDAGSILVHSYPNRTTVFVSASNLDRLGTLVADVRIRATGLIGDVRDTELDISVWSYGPRRGASAMVRRVTAPDWPSIAGNYPAAVRARLERLMRNGPPAGTGRLILWHGEPGTGKTTAVLALLDAWRDWCSGNIVVDAEKMFSEADYLQDVLSANPRARGPIQVPAKPVPQWNLVVAEDADEYLRADARKRSGPALGRLLNVSDGILGRGNRTILLLTTNDEVGRLHPAVTRPGRCLAITEFTRFNQAEAQRWLEGSAIAPAHGATLAELYQLRDGGADLGVTAAEPAPGAYL